MEIAIKMFDRESASLAKVFELTNISLQAFIHPAQQYASTFDTEDHRHHLDLINKVGIMQLFLTRIKNRSLEVQTITSGAGYVIS